MGVIARRRCNATENAVVNIKGAVGCLTGNQGMGSTIEVGRMDEQEYRRVVGMVGELGDLPSETTGA